MYLKSLILHTHFKEPTRVCNLICYTIHLLVTLSPTVCPGPPLNPSLASPVPPSVEVQWDRPATPDMWSFMYRIDWQNGTSAVGDTTDTRGTLSGLEAVTQYTVTITAFTDSTVCAEQSANFTFNTTQSEWWWEWKRISPWRRPEHLVKTSARFQPCFKAGIGEL